MIDKKELGEKIRDTRKHMHLTQEEFGERLCVSKQAVYNWEKGINYPDNDILEKLEAEYHIDLERPNSNRRLHDNMKIKKLSEIKEFNELQSVVDQIVNSIELEQCFNVTLKKMLKLVINLSLSYNLYYLPKVEKCARDEVFEWEDIMAELEAMLNEENSPETGKLYRHNTSLARTIDAYCFSIGAELFEDFEDTERYDYEIGDYGHTCGYNLLFLLPENENSLMTIFKASMLQLADALK